MFGLFLWGWVKDVGNKKPFKTLYWLFNHIKGQKRKGEQHDKWDYIKRQFGYWNM